ncbi:MAG TPA: ShlB/FhaC/HecB family hemolysin secretion/activation protein [Pseudomonadales bacterium]|nr:ShlB/FhaC/HecB family hemolysin secretion/activation protein [Pseudomonadales bacterium]
MTHSTRHPIPGLAAVLALTLVAPAFGADAASSDDAAITFMVDRIEVTGDNPLPEDLTRTLVEPWLGEQAGLLGLQNAADALEEAMAARGHGFHRVVLPPQRTESGTIELRVVVYRVAEIRVEGNEFFEAGNVLAMMPALRSGETPDTRTLARDLARANEHPAKGLSLTMRRSNTPDAIDAVLEVEDRKPVSLFASLSNRGSEETGDERLTVGAQHANVFDLDHVLTASYTTSPGRWSDVQQYGLSYRMPFYDLAADLTLFGTYSDVESGTVAEFFEVTGAGTSVSALWRQGLPNLGRWGQELQFSVTDTHFDNDVDFLGQPIGADVRTRPFGLGYSGEWVGAGANYGFTTTLVANLPGGRDNDDAAYAAARAGAEQDWYAVRTHAFVDWRISGPWLLRADLDAQYAGDPLVAGEQLGLGGAGSVRGFRLRETAADDGITARVELWLPRPRKDLNVLAFVDGGYGHRNEVAVGEDDDFQLASIGAGLRWQPLDGVRAVLDWALVVDGAAGVESGNHRLHFTLTTVL